MLTRTSLWYLEQYWYSRTIQVSKCMPCCVQVRSPVTLKLFAGICNNISCWQLCCMFNMSDATVCCIHVTTYEIATIMTSQLIKMGFLVFSINGPQKEGPCYKWYCLTVVYYKCCVIYTMRGPWTNNVTMIFAVFRFALYCHCTV